MRPSYSNNFVSKRLNLKSNQAVDYFCVRKLRAFNKHLQRLAKLLPLPKVSSFKTCRYSTSISYLLQILLNPRERSYELKTERVQEHDQEPLCKQNLFMVRVSWPGYTLLELFQSMATLDTY